MSRCRADQTELYAWKCPWCHRWHHIQATNCRCGFRTRTRMYSELVVAVLVMVIGGLILLTALQGRDIEVLERSGSAIEAEYTLGWIE